MIIPDQQAAERAQIDEAGNDQDCQAGEPPCIEEPFRWGVCWLSHSLTSLCSFHALRIALASHALQGIGSRLCSRAREELLLRAFACGPHLAIAYDVAAYEERALFYLFEDLGDVLPEQPDGEQVHRAEKEDADQDGRDPLRSGIGRNDLGEDLKDEQQQTHDRQGAPAVAQDRERRVT